MGIDRLKRVMWRLRKNNPGITHPLYNHHLKIAIMQECGTDPRTYKVNVVALKKLGFISRYTKARFTITDKDITS